MDVKRDDGKLDGAKLSSILQEKSNETWLCGKSSSCT